MDHVDDFPTMCGEIIRVLRPGGLLIGSFNLEEPPTLWEPQTLNMEIIQRNLLDFLDVDSCRTSRQGPADDEYAPFYEQKLEYEEGEKGFLWVRGRKRA
jgi:SAM-dependent methyltransferase